MYRFGKFIENKVNFFWYLFQSRSEFANSLPNHGLGFFLTESELKLLK